MTGNRVKSMAKKMRKDQFDWAAAGPIRVAERNGLRVIIDGHHRAAAAIRAKISRVPIVVETVSESRWNTLYYQALETVVR